MGSELLGGTSNKFKMTNSQGGILGMLLMIGSYQLNYKLPHANEQSIADGKIAALVREKVRMTSHPDLCLYMLDPQV